MHWYILWLSDRAHRPKAECELPEDPRKQGKHLYLAMWEQHVGSSAGLVDSHVHSALKKEKHLQEVHKVQYIQPELYREKWSGLKSSNTFAGGKSSNKKDLMLWEDLVNSTAVSADQLMTLLLWKCLADQIMWQRGLRYIYRLHDMFAKQLDYITTSPLHIETPKSKENSLLIYRPIWIYTMVQIIVIKVLALISKNSLNWSKFTAKIFMFRFVFQINDYSKKPEKQTNLGFTQY